MYADEKFTDAIYTLATSESSLSERLRDVYVSNLMNLEESDLPENLRVSFRSIIQRLEREEFDTTLARDIVDLAYEVADSDLADDGK